MRFHRFIQTMYAQQYMLPFGCLFIKSHFFEQLLDIRHSTRVVDARGNAKTGSSSSGTHFIEK